MAKRVAKRQTKVVRPKAARQTISRSMSVREEIRSTTMSCDIAAEQLRDDLILTEVEQAMEAISLTVETFQTIWLCGNGPGFSLSIEMAHRLMTPSSRYERATRAMVLGLNAATSTTSYGKCGSDDALSAELRVQGRRGDILWCFAHDASSQALLGVAAIAQQELQIPVIVFTEYPGTPLVRFATSKIRIQPADERDQSGYCVQWAHAFLANIMCNQTKRIARRTRA